MSFLIIIRNESGGNDLIESLGVPVVGNTVPYTLHDPQKELFPLGEIYANKELKDKVSSGDWVVRNIDDTADLSIWHSIPNNRNTQ